MPRTVRLCSTLEVDEVEAESCVPGRTAMAERAGPDVAEDVLVPRSDCAPARVRCAAATVGAADAEEGCNSSPLMESVRFGTASRNVMGTLRIEVVDVGTSVVRPLLFGTADR